MPAPATRDELRARAEALNPQAEALRLRVGERIRAAAKRRHMPMIAVADESGVSRSTLWAVLAGRTPATTDTLARIAAVLRVDPGELVSLPRPRRKAGSSKAK